MMARSYNVSYPFIRVWCDRLRMSQHDILLEVDRAASDAAPHDALFWTEVPEPGWVTVDDVANPVLRQQLREAARSRYGS